MDFKVALYIMGKKIYNKLLYILYNKSIIVGKIIVEDVFIQKQYFFGLGRKPNSVMSFLFTVKVLLHFPFNLYYNDLNFESI